MHILKIFGIDEKLKEILPTELITMQITDITEIFDNFMDIKILTESGKIIIFEFKKYSVRKEDLKQLFRYFCSVMCEEKRKVIPILITISEKGQIDCYKMDYNTFHPKIIKTKSISIQKDLNIIRKKFKDNKMLSDYQCSISVLLPIFKTDTLEVELVEETCNYIKTKRHCIPKGEYRKMIIPMYLNIVEYIKDKKEQDQLMEDINMFGEVQGEFARLRQEARLEERFIIFQKLSESFSIDEIAELLDENPTEIENMLNSK